MIFISKREGLRYSFSGKGCLTMPVSAAQHRATIGTHQNQLFENNRRSNITHTSVINRNSQHVQCEGLC
jgi:hypothetical protein